MQPVVKTADPQPRDAMRALIVLDRTAVILFLVGVAFVEFALPYL